MVSSNRRFSKETVGESTDVEPSPTNYQRLPIRSQLAQPPHRFPRVTPGAVPLSRPDDVDSQVGNPLALFTCRFCGADIEILVDLPRIRGDDGDGQEFR